MSTKRIATLRIVRASSREQQNLLPARLPELEAAGFRAVYEDISPDPTWTYSAGSPEVRTAALAKALLEDESDVVMCARGGYGASDLLPLLPWSRLAEKARPKLVVGFSDVSALHAALYSQLGWQGLHAPMPATVLWGKDGERRDLDALYGVLRDLTSGHTARGHIKVEAVVPANGASAAAARGFGPITGKLFGGCFTVVTALIGTRYFPRSLAGHIVFFEDTDEHPARLIRCFNQWLQSGALDGAAAIVVGHLRNLGDKIPDCAPFVYERLAALAPVPLFRTDAFGHTCPNMPMMIGAEATIEAGTLSWIGAPATRREPVA